MGQAKRIEFTTDEFLAWALEQPTGRYELDNGVVVAMSPERADHARVKGQAWLSLRRAIAARSLACEALPDGLTVRIGERTAYEPDALVRRGPPLPGDAIEAGDPVIVVEVVSPSSRGIDKGAKLAGYFTLPSVVHCLIVDTDQRVVIHHRRVGDGRIATRVVDDGPLALDPPGLTIEVADIFAGP